MGTPYLLILLPTETSGQVDSAFLHSYRIYSPLVDDLWDTGAYIGYFRIVIPTLNFIAVCMVGNALVRHLINFKRSKGNVPSAVPFMMARSTVSFPLSFTFTHFPTIYLLVSSRTCSFVPSEDTIQQLVPCLAITSDTQ